MKEYTVQTLTGPYLGPVFDNEQAACAFARAEAQTSSENVFVYESDTEVNAFPEILCWYPPLRGRQRHDEQDNAG